MLRKVFLVIDCADDKQCEQAQAVLNEISNMRVLTAERIIKAYPLFKQRETEIRQLFAIVSQGGVKGLLSMQGVSILTQLMRR